MDNREIFWNAYIRTHSLCRSASLCVPACVCVCCDLSRLVAERMKKEIAWIYFRFSLLNVPLPVELFDSFSLSTLAALSARTGLVEIHYRNATDRWRCQQAEPYFVCYSALIRVSIAEEIPFEHLFGVRFFIFPSFYWFYQFLHFCKPNQIRRKFAKFETNAFEIPPHPTKTGYRRNENNFKR